MKNKMPAVLLILVVAVVLSACLSSCTTVETHTEADAATALTETELNPTKRSESLLDHDGKVDCTSQVFAAGSKALCK